MQRPLSLAAALIAAGTSIAIHAADAVEPIVVTATRTAQTVDDSLAAVTVLTRADIETSQARSIDELLAGLPGVQVANAGGYGKATSVYLRGTNSDHTLVLIDGMRIGSATMGSVAFQDIPLESIERIEIVRGPRSSLYGADAIGGVIHIFTRGGTGAPRLRADVGAGSHDTYRVAAGLGGSHGNTRYDLDLSRFSSAGFNAQNDKHPDRDGYERNAASARVEHRFTPDHSLGFNALVSAGYNEYDGSNKDRLYTADTRQQALTAHWRVAPTELWHSTVMVGESKDESWNYTDGTASGTFRTRRLHASWQNDVQASDTLLLTLGADQLADTVRTSTAYDRTRRTTTGLFTQGQWRQGDHDWLFGLRHDDNDAYGRHVTGNLAWGYRLTDGTRLSAGYGSAFKAPTFNDLYYQDPWGSKGNPDLKPEKSSSAEIGIRNKSAVGYWELRVYRTHIENLIQWTEIAPWTWQPNNVGRARIDGIEVALGGTVGEWMLALTLDLTDARNSDTETLLINRARESARLDLSRPFGRLHTAVTWLAVGPRYANAANTQEIAGYGLINTAVRYDAAKDWHIEARIDNLFDQPYQQVRGYNTAGRTLFVNLSYRP